MRFFLTLFFYCSLGSFAFGQEIHDGIILKTSITDVRKLDDVLKQNARNTDYSILKEKSICKDLGLYYIEFSREISAEELAQIKALEEVYSVSYDEYLEQRGNPNDPAFNEQYALTLTKVNEVWAATTGGQTANDQQIVIAVIDDGMDITHPDLANNIFVNKAEIPNDGKDNDNNGVSDDYQVFNVDTGNGTPIIKSHGTSVAGIIGAEGNNNIGISGINWNIKILPILGVNKLNEIISAYDYVLTMRRLYKNTNGARGALIVATNYSGGITGGKGTDPIYKPWCDLYDLLGAEGIISAGSAPNENTNVDVEGDMPSTCTSPYFICATNIDATSKKVLLSGFGGTSVDIGAPGEEVETTKSGGLYGKFSGTSASAPMVAGTIALLYSVPCPIFGELIVDDPRAAGEIIRDAILNNTSPTSSLKDITTTGGYLNAFNALASLQSVCDSTIIPSKKGVLEITSIELSSFEATIRYIAPDENDEVLMLSNSLGEIIRYIKFSPVNYGIRTITLQLNDMPKGVYIISIIHGEEIASKTIFHTH